MVRFRQIKRPTLGTERRKLYYQGPPQLQERTRPNLDKKLRELIGSGEEVWFYAVGREEYQRC